ncbi:MAG: M3 family metallopeptidase [Thermoanaerobaculia bacterium]
MIVRRFAPLALALALSSVVFAEDFQSFTAAEKPRYRFDLTRTFYANDAAWEADLAVSRKLAQDLQSYRGKVADSGPGLLTVLEINRDLQERIAKLEVYRYLLYAADSTLEPKLTASSADIADLRAQVAFIGVELTRVSKDRLENLLHQEPQLGPFRFLLEQSSRYEPHTLSTAEEELVSRLSPQLFDWPGQIFQKLIDRTKFSDLATPGGPLNVYRDRDVLRKSSDRELRRTAMLKLREEYDANGDLFGFAMMKEAAAITANAEAHGFGSAFESSLFDAFLTPAQAESFFKTIEAFAPLARRYQALRRAHIQKVGHLDTVAPWDMEVVAPGFERPRFTISEATKVLTAALAFHGPAYSAALAGLLDPAQGRLDIVPGPNRVPGAFSWGSYATPHVFYDYGYRGYLEDVLTLAHEGGHAVHYDLIAANRVAPEYAGGPAYFTESFAMLNEFVTADYLVKNAANAELKTYYLEQLLDVMLERFFDIVMRSEFEYNAYRKIQAGEITLPADLDDLWQQEGLRYVGDPYSQYPFMKKTWAGTPHFFTSPRYYINYMFANLMAISYFERHLTDPAFDSRYVDLMVHGFPDEPIALLQKNLNLDPFDPKSIAGAMKILESKVTELETLYR